MKTKNITKTLRDLNSILSFSSKVNPLPTKTKELVIEKMEKYLNLL